MKTEFSQLLLAVISFSNSVSRGKLPFPPNCRALLNISLSLSRCAEPTQINDKLVQKKRSRSPAQLEEEQRACEGKQEFKSI